MNGAEERQMLASLSEISKDIKVLLSLISELTAQQDHADTRVFQRLSQIAHKR
jgi:hypothetical protein